MTKEHLIHLLELGHTIECKFISEKIGNEYKFILKDNYENLKNFLSIHRGDLINGTFKIVTPAPKLLPVGTKVVVLENCPDKEYIGKNATVEEVLNYPKNMYILDFSGTEIESLPHWVVAPIEKTEPHKYQEVIDLIEREGLDFGDSIVTAFRLNLLERIKNLK